MTTEPFDLEATLAREQIAVENENQQEREQQRREGEQRDAKTLDDLEAHMSAAIPAQLLKAMKPYTYQLPDEQAQRYWPALEVTIGGETWRFLRSGHDALDLRGPDGVSLYLDDLLDQESQRDFYRFILAYRDNVRKREAREREQQEQREQWARDEQERKQQGKTTTTTASRHCVSIWGDDMSGVLGIEQRVRLTFDEGVSDGYTHYETIDAAIEDRDDHWILLNLDNGSQVLKPMARLIAAHALDK